MWQLDGPQDGQRPHEGRDFSVIHQHPPALQHTRGWWGKASRDPVAVGGAESGRGEDPTKKDCPQPGQSLLPSPNDDTPLAPDTAASTGDWPEDEAGVGMGHRQAWAAGSPRPASPLWAPLPKLGALRRGSAPQRFLHATPGGEPHSGMAPAGGGMDQHTECPPAFPLLQGGHKGRAQGLSFRRGCPALR